MNETADDSSNSERHTTLLDWIRWLGALAAVTIAALLVVGSHYVSDLQVCEYNADAPSHEKCEPYPLDAAVPLFVLALALMWRDLSEFSIFGLGRVVRRIDDKQQQLQEGQAALQGQLSVIQSQTLTNNFFFGELREGLKEEFERVRQREPSLASEAEETPTAWSDLEAAWAALEPWSQLSIRLRDPYFRDFLVAANFDLTEQEARLTAADRNLIAAAGLNSDTDVNKLEGWASAAHRRLELVRKAVRAGPALPEPQVEQALAVARELLHELSGEGLLKSAD